MKKMIKLFLVLSFISTPALAIEFDKGSKVPDIHPRMLRKLLIQGKTTFQGAKIHIGEGVSIPSKYKEKWDEIKLSGGDVPTTGKAGDNVILIKSF